MAEQVETSPPTSSLQESLDSAAVSTESPAARVRRRFRRHRLAMVGTFVVLILIIVAVASPIVAGKDPMDANPRQSRQAPSSENILGTDQAGRDVWARVVYGTRISLTVGIVAVSIQMVISIIIGTASGYYGGVVDMAIMRFTDVMMVFPGLVLIMTVVSVLGPNIYNIMIVIGLLGWPGTARLVRGQILSIREWDYVLAARCVGVPDRRIMMVHVLPGALAPLLVAATFGVAGAILTEAGLSFLGLGVEPGTPSWGAMLFAAQSVTILERNWWLWLPPGLATLVTVLAINFIGDGLRDAMDPRMTIN